LVSFFAGSRKCGTGVTILEGHPILPFMVTPRKMNFFNNFHFTTGAGVLFVSDIRQTVNCLPRHALPPFLFKRPTGCLFRAGVKHERETGGNKGNIDFVIKRQQRKRSRRCSVSLQS
jgi:hypothetical protein